MTRRNSEKQNRWPLRQTYANSLSWNRSGNEQCFPVAFLFLFWVYWDAWFWLLRNRHSIRLSTQSVGLDCNKIGWRDGLSFGLRALSLKNRKKAKVFKKEDAQCFPVSYNVSCCFHSGLLCSLANQINVPSWHTFHNQISHFSSSRTSVTTEWSKNTYMRWYYI